MRVAVAIVVVGCGRIGFDPASAPSTDDAGIGVGPFSSVEPIAPANSDSSEDDPVLSSDRLELYFDSSRTGVNTAMGDLWIARRVFPSGVFTAPVQIEELASTFDDSGPWIASDNLTLYFNSTRGNGQTFDLYIATRNDRQSMWSSPVPIAELNSSADDRAAFVTPDDLAIYFTSNRLGSDDIFVATRATPTAMWNPPVPVAGLADPTFDEEEHWLSVDQLRVYYTANRGSLGQGARDLWFASRPDLGSPFGPAENITSLNTVEQEADAWLTPDERRILFSRRNEPAGLDLFTATR